MAYTTKEAVFERYPVLRRYADDSETQVNSLVYDAEFELNGMLASMYSVPFSETPPIIKDLATDLTYIKAIRYKDLEKAEDLQTLFDGRIERLKAGKDVIMTGSYTIIEPSLGAVDNALVWSSTGGYHPVFGMSDYEGTASLISSAQLQSEEDDRT